MSIWCSRDHIGTEDYVGYEVSPGVVDIDLSRGDGKRPHRRRVVHTKQRGDVRAYAEGWSNHYPTEDFDDPVAHISLAHIPVWCVPGHRDEEDDRIGPWVRLDVNSDGALTWWTKDGDNPTPEPVHASVVLDEDAARALIEDLTEWLAQPKAYPTTHATHPKLCKDAGHEIEEARDGE